MLNTASENGSIARRLPWELPDETPTSLLLPERRQNPEAEGAAPNPKGRRQGLLCPNQASVGESRDVMPSLPPILARNMTAPILVVVGGKNA
jgi:hypothetical protein